MGAQPPLGPEELSVPPLSGDEFLALLDEQFKAKCPEPPPFLQALCDGKLSQEHLQMWVKDQYPYWDEGLVFSTGAIFIKTNDDDRRAPICSAASWTSRARGRGWRPLRLRHPLVGGVVRLRFGTGVGLSQSEALEWHPFTRTYFAIQTLRTYSRFWGLDVAGRRRLLLCLGSVRQGVPWTRA